MSKNEDRARSAADHDSLMSSSTAGSAAQQLFGRAYDPPSDPDKKEEYDRAYEEEREANRDK